MKRTAIIIAIITILAKILGFVREIVLSYFYGVSNITDAYLISLTIPVTIFSFIGTGIATGYIPIYSNIIKEQGNQSAERFTNNIINFLLITCTILVLIVWNFTIPIVRLFASGFDDETLNLAVSFTRIGTVGIYFWGLIYVFSSFLQLKKDYIVPALMIIPYNLLMIMSIIFSKHSMIILPIGCVIAIIGQLLFLIPSLLKKGYKYQFILVKSDKFLKNLIYISLPVIIGVSVNQINVLIDKTLASQIVVGGISALNYANRISLFVQAIFVIPISTVLYPMISNMVAEGNKVKLKNSVIEAMNIISLFIIPTTIGTMVFSKPIVNFLFGRGAFDNNAISITSSALFFYSIGMIGFGFREILSKTFYSMQDTKTPMINAVIGVGLNIILNYILSKFLGIGGLALATSISGIFTTILLFISLSKKIGSFGIKRMFISFTKILLASLIMGVFAKVGFNFFVSVMSQNLSLFISIGIGAIIYFVIIYCMRIEDVDIIVNAIKKRLRRNGGESLI